MYRSDKLLIVHISVYLKREKWSCTWDKIKKYYWTDKIPNAFLWFYLKRKEAYCIRYALTKYWCSKLSVSERHAISISGACIVISLSQSAVR